MYLCLMKIDFSLYRLEEQARHKSGIICRSDDYIPSITEQCTRLVYVCCTFQTCLHWYSASSQRSD